MLCLVLYFSREVRPYLPGMGAPISNQQKIQNCVQAYNQVQNTVVSTKCYTNEIGLSDKIQDTWLKHFFFQINVLLPREIWQSLKVLSRLGVVIGVQRVGAKDAVNHPTMHRTTTHTSWK